MNFNMLANARGMLFRHPIGPGDNKPASIGIIMRLILFLTLAFTLQATAEVVAQRVSLSATNAPLKQVLQELRKQSGYSFIYSDQDVVTAAPVTLQVNGAELLDVLPEVFKGQSLSYTVSGKIISVTPMAEQPTRVVVQEETRGRVVDSAGNPLVGASIRVLNAEGKRTALQAKSDYQGYFVLHRVPSGSLLEISYVGYETETIGASDDLASIALCTIASELEEVEVMVSTGYQTLPKERVTGSFEHVGQALLNRSTAPNIIDRLEGLVASLQFDKRAWGSTSSNEGKYGLRVRGVSSLSNSDAPLIIWNDFPYDGDINSINPDDVESITILKDAAAASIWGARAGNGVIVIQSKRGRYGQQNSWNFGSNVSISLKPDLKYNPNYINSKEYIELERAWFDAGVYTGIENNLNLLPLSPVVETLVKLRDGTISSTTAENVLGQYENVDFQEESERYLYQPRIQEQYTFNSNGGSEKHSFFVSSAFVNEQGQLRGNANHRFTINASNAFKLSDKFEFNGDLGFINQVRRQNGLDHFGIPLYYPYSQLMADGEPAVFVRSLRETYTESAQENGLMDWSYRPLEERNLLDNRVSGNQIRVTPSIKYQVMDWLSFGLGYQFDQESVESRVRTDKNSFEVRDLVNKYTQPDGRRPFPHGDILRTSHADLKSHSMRFKMLIDDLKLSSGRIDGLVGAEVRQFRDALSGNTLYGYDDDVLTAQNVIDYVTYFQTLPRGTGRIPAPAFQQEDKLDRYVSYYGNLSYSHDDKYVLTGSARWDASNLFGVNINQKGVPLWSLGASWTLSKEAFYALPSIPYLRLRATHGYNGNIDRSVSAFTTAVLTTNFETGFRQAAVRTPGNRNLRWERINVTNIGLDFRLKDNVLSGELEWYVKHASDLLGALDIDPTIFYAGSGSYVRMNYADLKTEGFELTFRSAVGKGDVRWQGQLMLSHAANRLEKYFGGELSSITTYTSGNSKRAVVGKSLDALYSLPWSGLDPETGDPLVIENGQYTKEYTRYLNNLSYDSLRNHGSSVPTFFGGFLNTFQYKDVSLSFNISFKAGYYFRRNTISYSSMMANGKGMHRDFYDRWIHPGDEQFTQVPSLPLSNIANRDMVYGRSEALVANGTHLRLQDVQLNWNLKKLTASRPYLGQINVFVNASNLGILWKNSRYHLDPDYPNAPILPSKTIAMGLRITK